MSGNRRATFDDIELRSLTNTERPPGVIGQVECRMVPFDVPGNIGLGVREIIPASAITDIDGIVGRSVTYLHGEPIGRISAVEKRDDGLYGVLDIADTATGRDAMTLVQTRSVSSVSIEFMFDPAKDVWNRARSLVTRGLVAVRGIALTNMPAYDGATITAHREEPRMTDILADEAPTPATPAPSTPAEPVMEYATRSEVDAIRNRLAAVANVSGSDAHPLMAYRSLGEYAKAVFTGAEERALLEQITTDNPGLVQPHWLTDIKGIVDNGRPVINALGGPASAGTSGMAIDFPYFDGTLTDLVAAQAAELDEVTSVLVKIKKGDQALATYAGGSSQSLQLLERSSPSYLTAYMRIMYAAYAAVTDKALGTAAVTAATSSGTYAADFSTFEAKLVQAAVDCANATGAGPDVVAVGDALFVALASLKDTTGRPLYPFVGASNASGTVGRGALALSIAGLPVVRTPGVAANTALITNSLALKWHEDGPKSLSADVASTLGRDVAVYGFAAPVAYVATGIRKITKVP